VQICAYIRVRACVFMHACVRACVCVSMCVLCVCVWFCVRVSHKICVQVLGSFWWQRHLNLLRELKFIRWLVPEFPT